MKRTGKAADQDRARVLGRGPAATVRGRDLRLLDDDMAAMKGKERRARAGLLARGRHLSA